MPSPMVPKDGMNALRLAICGNHPDIVKMLVDEFDVSLNTKGPVSIKSLKLKLTHADAHTSMVVHACLQVLHVAVCHSYICTCTLFVHYSLGRQCFTLLLRRIAESA